MVRLRHTVHPPSHVSHALDFVASLQARLSTSPPALPVDDQLLDSLKGHVRTLHSTCQKTNHPFSGNEELDKLGTSIWNLSTRLLRDTDGTSASPERRKLPGYARVFAFYLLDAAQPRGKANFGSKVRLMRLALKAGRSSIGM